MNRLLQILGERYDIDQFKTLCMNIEDYYPELKVKYDNLGGEGLQGKARELILQVRRYGNIQGVEKLISVIDADHPDLNLPVPEELRLGTAVAIGSAGTTTRPASPADLNLPMPEELRLGTAATPSQTNPMTTNPSPAVIATPQKEFINFDLRIYPKQGQNQYPIEASHNHEGGAGTGTINQTFDLDDPDLKNLFLYLQELVAEGADAKEFGGKLRDLLFPSQTWTLFNTLRQDARREGKGVRLRLRIDPPELSRLPWEYCYDSESRLFFAQDLNTPVVRYFQRPYTPDALATSGPLKILMVMADPTNLPRLDMAKEEATLRHVLKDKLNSGQVVLEVLRNTTTYKLQHKVSEMEPQVLHFVGHGEFRDGQGGALCLEDDNQLGQRLTSEQLANLLRNRGVRLVVLNACQTAAGDEGDAFMSVAPALVLADIPAVIAMQFVVPDAMAIRYTHALYDYLTLHKPLDLAVTEMRLSAASGSAPEDQVLWGIPVLFMRAPDGVIWQRPTAGSASASTSPVANSGGGGTAAPPPAPIHNDNRVTNKTQVEGTNFSTSGGNVNISVGGDYSGRDSTKIAGNQYNVQGNLIMGGQDTAKPAGLSLPELLDQIEKGVEALLPHLDEYDSEDLPEHMADARKELDRQRLPKVAKELRDARDIVRKHKAIAPTLLAHLEQAMDLAEQ